MLLAKSLTGEELAHQLISMELSIPTNRVVAFM